MKIILINSHLQSGSGILYQSLASHSLVQGCKISGMKHGTYLSNYDLTSVFFSRKKKNLFYLDEILFNQSLSTKLDYKNIFVINLVRRPKETLESLVELDKIKPIFALRYYQYRLNRMHQISKKANNCLFLKLESLEDDGIEKVANFLNLENLRINKEKIKGLKKDFKKSPLSKELLSIAEKRYETYHWLLGQNSVA